MREDGLCYETTCPNETIPFTAYFIQQQQQHKRVNCGHSTVYSRAASLELHINTWLLQNGISIIGASSVLRLMNCMYLYANSLWMESHAGAAKAIERQSPREIHAPRTSSIQLTSKGNTMGNQRHWHWRLDSSTYQPICVSARTFPNSKLKQHKYAEKRHIICKHNGGER
jgi:hypothetical protein